MRKKQPQRATPTDAPIPDWAEDEPGAYIPAEGQVFLVAPNRLTRNPQQPRLEFDLNVIKKMAANMKRLHFAKRGFRGTGVIQPLSVKYPSGITTASGMAKHPDLQFIINAGETRWRAATEAELPLIPVYIEDVNEDDAYEIAYFENVHRKDISPIEEALALNRIKHRHKLTNLQMVPHVNKTLREIEGRLQIIKYPKDVLELLSNRPASLWYADRISKIENKKVRQKLISMIYDGKTQSYITEQIKYFRGEQDKQKRLAKAAAENESTENGNSTGGSTSESKSTFNDGSATGEVIIVSNYNLPQMMDSINSQFTLVSNELRKVTVTPSLRRTTRKELLRMKATIERVEEAIKKRTPRKR